MESPVSHPAIEREFHVDDERTNAPTPIVEESQSMHTSFPRVWLFGIGAILQILALILKSITLAGQHYRTALVTALAFTLTADGCFIATFIRGNYSARCASVVLMLPTVSVVEDFMRRAPGSF